MNKLAFGDLPVPNYTTLCHRARDLDVVLSPLRSGEPLHLVADSTDLKVFGEGEWKIRKHGYSLRRTWRKAHLAMDANTGQIRTAQLSPALAGRDVDVPFEGALRQEPGGAHDWRPGHQSDHPHGRAQSHGSAGPPAVRPYRVNSWKKGSFQSKTINAATPIHGDRSVVRIAPGNPNEHRTDFNASWSAATQLGDSRAGQQACPDRVGITKCKRASSCFIENSDRCRKPPKKMCYSSRACEGCTSHVRHIATHQTMVSNRI
jgi:hypothetical protein